ncbi:hypothetical protein [uncultured Pontibacter sp.]|uniref:THUMP-like domain-containing protein n=1 Tax=uncultured Pontibacter sp. TaxID=453356 RepID=UPI00260E48D4|nr:hypothetical protein [uncultured Pontibacter sp.]
MRLFTPEEKQFIQKHLHQAPATLMLQASRYPQLPVLELVQQIQARQKAAAKLPLWAQNPDVVFPVTLSVEQSSSEPTAAFKASLVTGNLLIDLTGGFGVDSLYFAKQFKQVIHLEQNQELQEIAAYNFNLLGAANIQSMHATAEAFLQHYTGKADVIYLDPARRGGRDEKLHLLQDCEPDVLHLLPLLFEKAEAVLLKTSPMLDIDQALEQLKHVHQLWVVAVQNEVKEVLYLLQANAPAPDAVKRNAVNLSPQAASQTLSFTRTAEEAASPVYTDPQEFVYEPNAAILKAGAFRFLSQQYKLNKLHPNSHLYTSAVLVPDFPGRSFRCTAVCRYNKKELMRYLPAKKANVTVRNFPEPVAEIRRKTGIKEGGDIYLFFTTDMHQKPVVLVCSKV